MELRVGRGGTVEGVRGVGGGGEEGRGEGGSAGERRGATKREPEAGGG